MDDAISVPPNELVDSYQCVMREMWGLGVGDGRGCGLQLELTIRAFAPNIWG